MTFTVMPMMRPNELFGSVMKSAYHLNGLSVKPKPNSLLLTKMSQPLKN